MRAAFLALLFAGLSALPWLHVWTATGRAAHACCHHAAGSGSGPAGAMLNEETQGPEVCWVCESLVSLLQHAQSDLASLRVVAEAAATIYFRAPQAPACPFKLTANRSQAPPAAA